MGHIAAHICRLHKGCKLGTNKKISDYLNQVQKQAVDKVEIFEVPTLVTGEHLSTYLSHFRQILGATCDSLNGGMEF